MCNCNSNAAASPEQAASTDWPAFKVEDMTCGHCVGVIDKALHAGLPGAEVAINLARHEVRVSGDPATAEAIMLDAGYTPVRL